MKLNDLIDALAAEVELAQADLERSLGELAARAVDDAAFVDAFELYSGQAQRMGEAASLAGFPGLEAVCQHVAENTLLLPALPPGERGPLIEFLRRWPALTVHHLRNLSDPSTAAGLVDHLRAAPSPMEEERALKVMHMLGAMPLQVGVGVDESQPLRPVLALPEDVALELPADADEHMLAGFLQEAPEQARQLVAYARALAAGEGDSSDVVAAKRVAHTLKGSGSILGVRGIASLGHHLEDILEHAERSDGRMGRHARETLLDAAWCVEQMVGFMTGADDLPAQAQPVLQAVLDLANRLDRGEPVEADGVLRAPAANAGIPSAVQEPAPAARAAGAPHGPASALRVSLARIEALFRVSGEASVQAAAMETRIKDVVDRSRELLVQNLRLQKRLFELETVVDVRTLSTLRERSMQTERPGFDPLELDQYSELHSTTHALVEEAADARMLAVRLEEEIAGLAGLQAQQKRLSDEMQHIVIGTRMTEVGALESRLQRNVRATCKATGKEAGLVVVGGQTLVDSEILNRLGEPLLHLLRNAVDHGLEPAGVRLAAGKPAAGRIELAFRRQGQQLVVTCRDDGAGMDLAAVRHRAIERGLVAADQVLGEEDTARLVLLPGFSTRDRVTEVSGRGVGLDVVREFAVAMNGSIRIETGAGRGCVFEMRVAATLSTVQSLIVEAAGQRYALPAVQVVQALPRGVGAFELQAGRALYRHDGTVYPALRLAQAAGLREPEPLPLEEQHAVVVRVDDQVKVLAVDRLLDARELLVKSPGRYARHLRGVAGLSILGDGSVALNLDLLQLLAPDAGARRGLQDGAADSVQEPAGGRQQAKGVLIVDDAFSVRNALQQLVQDAGYVAKTARDGMEAVDALRSFRPDVVLTDLEMPNMNGVEFTAHLRGREDLRGLPVIMITSRSQEKHRRMAQQAGVDTYLTKPYRDEELLDTLRQALAG
ncbi:hybrid sensor histidine kinase/response regulator [Ramlibacter tataouinensis]|uniref:Chemotaxis protein CheA n=1 Tax=Ramlibacter tataouinensis (strain ATCC BAA-407 / DSM 14655 / LMG 21543 / TTB310) TaxID=365046 RepID=F5XX81_RAMTT|nr:response regulator [Ramlibacter tataouinensis]AEG93025.1 candidate histidine kinase, CheA [Ramlibacter tataouinensis TTB310]